MNAIPAGYSALFLSDPLAAGLDTWAFTIQMRRYFESGLGKDLFGAHQSVAIKTFSCLEIQFKGYMHEFNKQRLESFKYIDQQRNLVFLELERERQLVFDDLRRLIREEIHHERVKAFKDLEPLIDKILDQRVEKIESPIDHFFIRLLEDTIFIGIALIILYILKPRFLDRNRLKFLP